MTRELRVFISSTFRDLSEEREQLTKKVFPALRALCRERGVEFTEIDLRWGLTDEEAHNGKIIRTCFEEIDACRPYFIGIIGSRYGWVPPFAEIQKDPLLTKRFPWIEDAALEDTSILEMEFDYAALRDPSSARSAFFYLRRDRGISRRFEEANSARNTAKLEQLRERVRTSGLPYREYSGAETLGEMIYDDLVETINRTWPQEDTSVADRERYQHEAFAVSRRHAYIANPERIRRLTALTCKEKRSVVIEAPSGSGKSALAAYWSHHLRESDPKLFIVEYYVGAGGGSGDGAGIAQHIIREIADRYTLPDEIPSKPEDCLSQLSSWLARITDECIVVIDAVNQLDEASSSLRWLPDLLPPAVRVVVTTTDGEIASSLVNRGWMHETLEMLTHNEREAIIIRYLNEFHKSLSLEQSKRIAGDTKCALPLFLRTMLEELRLVGSHRHLDSIIDRYLGARDTDDLFQIVLERLEEDFGSRIVRELMSLIWASRQGLSHRELGELMPITHMKLSTLLLALDYHLQRHSGLLTFFHDYLRRAVELRYIPTHEAKKYYYVCIGEFMSQEPLSMRRIDEELWQWHHAQEWEKLKDALFDSSILASLVEPEKIHEFSRYWRDLQQHLPVATKEAFLYPHLGQKEQWQAIVNWAKFHEYYGSYSLAKELYEHVIADMRGKDETQTIEFADALDGVSSVYYELQNFEAAERYLKEAIGHKELLVSQEDISSIKSYSNLGAVMYAKGNVEDSINIFRKCVDLCIAHLGEDHSETAVNLNNLAFLEFSTGKHEQALTHFQDSLRISEKRYGPSHPTVGRILENIGAVQVQRGQYPEAKQSMLRALDIMSRIYSTDHPEIAKIKNTLGIVERMQQNYDTALEYFQDAFTIREALYGKRQYETLNTMLNIARTRALKQDFQDAVNIVNEVYDLMNSETTNTGPLHELIGMIVSDIERSEHHAPLLASIKHRID